MIVGEHQIFAVNCWSERHWVRG